MNGLTLAPRPSAAARSNGVVARPDHAAYVVAALLVVVVLLQRVGVPRGDLVVPLTMPIGLAVGALLTARGAVRASPVRTALFALASGFLALAAYGASWSNDAVRAIPLLVVLGVFTLWTVRVSGDAATNARGARLVGNVFVSLMLAAALVACGQMFAQLAGFWTYQDVIAEWVPAQYLLPNYNTSIPTSYASPIYKSQAFVFLEPSIFSQFTALAVVLAILLRRPMWQVLVLVIGLVTALSGTGLILLACGLGVLLVRSPRSLRVGYVVAGLLTIIIVLVTPAAKQLGDRVNEAYYPTSSLGLRFVLPYEEVAAGLTSDQMRLVHGAGPGASDRVLESGRTSAGLAVVYTAPAKLLFEYGLVPAMLFLLFIGVALFRGPPFPVIPTMLAFQLCFLGGYLVAPHALFTAWCLTVAWSRRA